jgi:hypothetical protein
LILSPSTSTCGMLASSWLLTTSALRPQDHRCHQPTRQLPIWSRPHGPPAPTGKLTGHAASSKQRGSSRAASARRRLRTRKRPGYRLPPPNTAAPLVTAFHAQEQPSARGATSDVLLCTLRTPRAIASVGHPSAEPTIPFATRRPGRTSVPGYRNATRAIAGMDGRWAIATATTLRFV